MDLRGIEAAMYLRKSRPEDGLDTDAILQKHWDTLTELAEREGIRVVGVYREVRSGEFVASRPEMVRLLADVEAKKVQAVLCMDLDRLSRGGTRDRGWITETFQEAEVLIITPGKVYDLQSESDEALVELGGFVANFELRQNKKRTAHGKERAARDGCSLAHAPFGYVKCRVNRRATLKIVDEEAKYVRLIFERYASGVGCTVIADWLNALGVKGKRGKEFCRESVQKIITNPVYIGKVLWNRTRWKQRKDGKYSITPKPKEEWILSEGLHPPIVDKALFDTCQAIMAGRYKPPSNDGTVKSPLVGLVRCAKCGSRMQKCPNSSGNYMRCLARGCSPGTKLEYVEDAILDALRDRLEALETRPLADTAEADSLAGRLAEIDAAIAETDRKKAVLYDLLEDGTYSRPVFAGRMALLLHKVEVLNQERAETVGRLEALNGANPEKQVDSIRNVLDLYADADAAGRNALLRGVVDVVYYHKDKGTGPRDFALRVVPKF